MLLPSFYFIISTETLHFFIVTVHAEGVPSLFEAAIENVN